MSKNHTSGGKVTKSHSTMIDAAQPVVKAAERHTKVTKVVLGRIESVRSKQQRIKFEPVPAGLKVTVYGTAYLQELVVYCAAEAQTEVQQALFCAF